MVKPDFTKMPSTKEKMLEQLDNWYSTGWVTKAQRKNIALKIKNEKINYVDIRVTARGTTVSMGKKTISNIW